MFLFDVGSDILNGINFIKAGNLIWGWSVIGVTFLPMTVAYTFFAIQALSGSSPFWKKLLILLLAPILAPIAIPIMTAAYIVHVAYVFARKFVQPQYTDDRHMAGQFKVIEGVLEANFQAVLGLFKA